MTGDVQEEGVSKFDLQYSGSPAVAAIDLRELNAWRRLFRQLELIGQDPERYGGYGFGNVSQRVPPYNAPIGKRPFIVTGTQTGALARLDDSHYVLVTEYSAQYNRIVATGPIKPSSESLTHGMIYNMDDMIHFVLHVHSPDIWQAAASLNIPETSAAVQYGTPEMAREVQRLFRETALKQKKIFSMRGHPDGVMSFGTTAQEAGGILIEALAMSYSLQ